MSLTVTTHLWFPGIWRTIQRLLGLSFDLGGIVFDQRDLDVDLDHGRD
jgi:hypothetical protein